MSFQTWITTQTFSVKLIFGIAVGSLIYFGLRYLIYLANKDSKKISAEAPTLNSEQKLELMATD